MNKGAATKRDKMNHLGDLHKSQLFHVNKVGVSRRRVTSLILCNSFFSTEAFATTGASLHPLLFTSQVSSASYNKFPFERVVGARVAFEGGIGAIYGTEEGVKGCSERCRR